jgi:hypothetical protein
MAKGNMIVTLVAQTKNFSNGLRNAGDSVVSFGKVVGAGMSVALGALGALFLFIPNFIKMGEEARKSELRLANIAKVTGLYGDETEKVTKRISEYAEALSFSTGVDDELIRGNQAVLLTFKELAKSAGVVGGAFDRATVAALDLSAAGLGDAESSAIQLGKALQDPTNGLTALRRAGVTFTAAEKDKIRVLMETGRQLEAQDEILKAIEGQVGGTAEATASATDKMNAKFESVVEELSFAFLPAVDAAADALVDWLDSTEGKKAIDDLKGAIQDFSDWITSPEGAKTFEDFAATMGFLAASIKFTVEQFTNFLKALKDISDWFNTAEGQAFLQNMANSGGQPGFVIPNDTSDRNDWLGIPNPSRLPTVADRVVVNVSGITPTATIGRTVLDAVKEAQRLGQR